MKELLAIMLGGIIMNNLVFVKLLGISPVLMGRSDGKKAIINGAFVALIMFLAAIICFPIEQELLKEKLEFLRIFVYVIVVFGVASIVDLIARKISKRSFGLYFYILALSGAVLGLALLNTSDSLSFVQSVFASLGAGLGFMLAMWLFAGVQGRIQEKYVPAAFKGLPITVLAAAIIAMAFLAF